MKSNYQNVLIANFQTDTYFTIKNAKNLITPYIED